MDKNNDIQVNKVSKWEAAPKSIRMMLSTINGLCDGLTGEGFSCEEAAEFEHLLVSGLEDVLDDYNELEAKYQKQCGMISEYEEENRDLKDALISRVFKQDEEYTKLESVNEELRSKCETQEDEIDKLETKYAKATRFIARLTEALNEAGVSFHYVKFSGDDEEIFYIDSLDDRMAKKHYEEQSFRLRNTVRNYGEQIRCFKNSIRALQEFLKKCGVPVKHRNDDTWYWDFENSAWDDTLMKDCKLIDKCRELEKENNKLKKENDELKAVDAWFNMFIDMRHKRDLLKKEYENLKETNKSLRRTVRVLDGEDDV